MKFLFLFIGLLMFSFVNAQCPEFDFSATVVHPLCNGDSTGAITCEVSGGASPYVFEIRNESEELVNDGHIAENLPAGSYTVDITDSEGCDTSFVIALNEPSSLNFAELGGDDGEPGTFCSLYVAGTGGVPGYSYEWTMVGNPDFSSSHSSVGVDEAGCYIATITDGNGCQLSDTVCVGWLGEEALLMDKRFVVNYVVNSKRLHVNSLFEGDLQFFDMTGRFLVQYNMHAGHQEFDLTGFPAFVIYQAVVNKETFTGKLLIH